MTDPEEGKKRRSFYLVDCNRIIFWGLSPNVAGIVGLKFHFSSSFPVQNPAILFEFLAKGVADDDVGGSVENVTPEPHQGRKRHDFE